MGKQRGGFKTAQFSLRLVTAKLIVATNAVESFDRSQIKEVIDGGVGLHTIVLAKAYERACDVMSSVPYTANTRMEVVATDYDRVTIQATDLAGVATDADYQFTIVGSDKRFDV